MSSMNSLAAAFKLNDVITPKSNHIRELIVDALITLDVGEEDTYTPAVVHLLCQAYTQCLDDEEDRTGKEIKFLQGAEAEKRFIEAATKAYKSQFPQNVDVSENLPSWPEALPYDERLPVKLLDYAGYMLGYRTAQSTKLWYEYVEKNGGPCVA